MSGDGGATRAHGSNTSRPRRPARTGGSPNARARRQSRTATRGDGQRTTRARREPRASQRQRQPGQRATRTGSGGSAAGFDARPRTDCPGALPQGEPDKPESGAAATRQIVLAEAEDAALAMLRKKLKREPNFEEFWLYITEHDDTGTISDYTDDRLMWTGKDGRNCETAKSTMRNRLTTAKSRNPFKL